MKTTNKNQNKKNSRLLTSELINFKAYKTQTKNHLNQNSLFTTTNFSFIKQTSFNLKKILQIIFKYHLNRKKILVVGEKQLVQKQFFYIHKKTNHIFLSKTAWVNGLLSNNKTIKKFLKKKNPILKLIKNPRLIVSYNYWNLIDSESYSRRITNVTLTNNYLESKYRYDKSPAYSISGNLTEIRKKKIQFFISTLIEKIIKLPKLTRQYYKIYSLYKKKRKNKKMSKKNYYNKTNKRINPPQKNFSRYSFTKNDSKTKI